MTGKIKKTKKTTPLRRKRIFIKCGFNTELDLHPFKVLSPRCFLVPKRPMNGLSMIPWPNQASLSARSLSRSLDELGLKYLHHREETKPSNTDSLFKTSTSFRSKKQITQLLTICKKKKKDALQHTWSELASTSREINVLQHNVSVSHCYVHQLWLPIRGSQEHNRSPAFKPNWKRRACYSSLTYLWPGAMVTQRSSASRTSRRAGNLRWCMIAWNKTKINK